MTSEQAQKLSQLAIRYAALRDEMYHAVRVDDWDRHDRAVPKLREIHCTLWDLGHELMEEAETEQIWRQTS